MKVRHYRYIYKSMMGAYAGYTACGKDYKHDHKNLETTINIAHVTCKRCHEKIRRELENAEMLTRVVREN